MVNIVYKFLEQSNAKATPKSLDISVFKNLDIILLTCYSSTYIFLYMYFYFFDISYEKIYREVNVLSTAEQHHSISLLVE